MKSLFLSFRKKISISYASSANMYDFPLCQLTVSDRCISSNIHHIPHASRATIVLRTSISNSPMMLLTIVINHMRLCLLPSFLFVRSFRSSISFQFICHSISILALIREKKKVEAFFYNSFRMLVSAMSTAQYTHTNTHTDRNATRKWDEMQMHRHNPDKYVVMDVQHTHKYRLENTNHAYRNKNKVSHARHRVWGASNWRGVVRNSRNKFEVDNNFCHRRRLLYAM